MRSGGRGGERRGRGRSSSRDTSRNRGLLKNMKKIKFAYFSDMDLNSDYASLEEIRTPMLILYEGNIACGKSTIMQKYEDYTNVDLMCEPLKLWENFHGTNLLELRYSNREKFEFIFQILAYISRFEQMNEVFKNNSIKMLERSLYSSFEVFVEYSNKVMGMNPLEYEMLKYIFGVTKQGILNNITRPDLMVYIKTDSDVCFERMINRNRSAEKTVPFDVIEGLHQAHENWLFNEEKAEKIPCPIIILDGNLEKKDWLIQVTKINRKILEIANLKRKMEKL
jgi:deoxyadenosine/deoxycytidine kinase